MGGVTRLLKQLSSSTCLALMGATLALSSCMPTQDATIVAPAQGAKLVKQALAINIAYPAGSDTPTVVLNDRNISAFVDYQETSATANGEDFEYAIAQGINFLELRQSGSQSVRQVFTYDNAGPAVEVMTTNRIGDNVIVTGKAKDASEITKVSINSQTVALNDNDAFSVTIPKAESYGIYAEDEHGIKSYDYYLPAGASIDPMIRASVDETLIDDISPVIAKLLVVPKQEAVFDFINPVVAGQVGGIRFAVDLVKFQSQQAPNGELLGEGTVYQLGISPESSTGTVIAGLSITKPEIGVNISITGPNAETPTVIKARIKADNLDINGANVQLATDENDVFKLAFTGLLPVDLTNTVFELEDSGPIISGLLALPAVKAIVSTVTDGIEGVLAQVLPGFINAEIARILPSDLFLGLNFNNDDALFKAGVSKFATDGTKLLVDLAAQYQAKNPLLNDYALGIKAPSSIDQETGEVTLGGALPLPKDDGQLNAAVSFDFINQAMLFAYEAGLLNLNLVGGQLVPAAQVASVAQEGDLWIQVSPSIPELELFGDDMQANLDINLNNFELNVRRFEADNSWSDFMNLSVGVNLIAGFGFDATAKELFLVASDQQPMIDLMRVSALGIDVPPSLANGVVNIALPVITDVLLQNLRIKLPIPAELPIELVNISTIGDQNSHLNLSMNVDLASIIDQIAQNGVQ